jgi:hypothetical protein
MRKSFRAVTAFTGVAAAAAVFAPAAGAATGAPEFVPRSGAGRAANCTTRSTGGLTLYYTKAEKHSVPACVSGSGYVPIGPKEFASYCGGSYYGYLWIKGKPERFTSGFVYHKLDQTVSGISIYPNFHLILHPGDAAACKGKPS